MRIVIVGAGIGGLAVALALAQSGKQSLVLEAAPQLGEIGAGIQLGPNAFHVLDQLGMGETLLKGAVYVDSFRLMDSATGRQINRFSFGAEFRQRFGNPYVVVHRADLHRSLLDACTSSGLVEIRTGVTVECFEQDARAVRAVAAGGRRFEGDALIGADGLHSAVRAQIVRDGSPRVSGHTTYRSVVDVEAMPEEFRWNSMTIWVGPKTHIVHYPLKGAKLFNLVATAHDEANLALAGASATDEEVAGKFAHLVPDVRRIISCGRNWKKWVLCDREPVENWNDSRVTLLGDAAHPTLQYFAQGACMAMEDGMCLANALGTFGPDVVEALDAYRRERLVRTARIQLGSRLIGDHIFHPSGVHALTRNATLQSIGDTAFMNALAWLYDAGSTHTSVGRTTVVPLSTI
jgi:2-polyprenyl-6-methoxyphenol hydroxylase-like FAD-dependent oxidoreductase